MNIGMKHNSLFGRIYSFLIFSMTMNAQPKGYLYDESKVIPYELPDPLVCQDGTKVETAQTWIEKPSPINQPTVIFTKGFQPTTPSFSHA
ncbi:MAG: hypothetical protein EBS13_07640 [Verrucomicrobia bacterium]|nr:hypothetical protein [Verrucomicrobiota bacterium]